MSAETIQAIEDAIQAHVTDKAESDDEPGVVAWIVHVAYLELGSLDTERTHGYSFITPIGQAFHTSAGLATLANESMKQQWNED